MKVLIYSGLGVHPDSLKHTVYTFTRLISQNYDVKCIDHDGLNNEPWEISTECLIIPGGRDVDYLTALKSETIQKIRAWVVAGGKYIGICGGAYFASKDIEFEIGRCGFEINASRPLSLFIGTAKGSITPNFIYDSESGAVALKIEGEGQNSLNVYANGGCYFDSDLDGWANSEIAYNSEYKGKAVPTVIMMHCGKGKALLSGVHLEYSPNLLRDHPLFGALSSGKSAEDALFELLKKLGLHLSSPDTSLSPEWIAFGNLPSFINAPVDIHKCQGGDNFDTLYYNSKILDQLKIPLIYGDVMTSTQHILTTNPRFLQELPNGTVFLAGHQTNGRGRGTNKWVSINGCLQFSMVIDFPVNSGCQIQMVQYIAALSVVQAAKKLSQEKAHVAIKWPNDIYSRGQKIGGLLVNAESAIESTRLIVGIGVNVESNESTRCLNDELDLVMAAKVTKHDVLKETYAIFSYMFSNWISSKSFPFDEYYSLWLHKGRPEVFLDVLQNACRIEGIDSEGFLLVSDESGKVHHLQPDGNSFDLMRNLIHKKA